MPKPKLHGVDEIRYSSPMTFAELVTAAAAGDQRAWKRMAARLESPLGRWFAARLHGFDNDALVQDTLIILWKKLPDFEMRSEAAFFRWMYRIANHVALAALRQAAQENKRTRALGQMVRAPSTRLSSLLFRAERIEMVLREAGDLPNSYRRAIETMLAGGDARDLARDAEIEWSSARRQMSRALQRLRERLRPSTPESPKS
jgi:DNA-directed RNA polymerase specialized sigma24 family protein